MTMPETTQSDLVEREEMQVSAREHSDVSEHVLREAIKLARERGGQTIPVSDYDILRARDTIADEQSEVTRLTAELHAAKEEAARLRGRCEAMSRALEMIKGEVGRTNGNLVHLRRCVGVQCKAGLAAYRTESA